MRKQITLLSERMIDQIAAGEVVENPSSVVKELIENSIDAGAAFVDVTLQEGGKQRIVVEDDGDGMEVDDLKRSILRHATSKVGVIEDLFSLSTFGFRGEAMAAIASVSRMEVISHPKNSPQGVGYRIFVVGGEVVEEGPCPRREGTSVTVEGLFFNVPVRRKFQKGAASCAHEVIATVQLFALSYPEIGFSLTTFEGEKILFQPATLSKRIEAIFGTEFLASSWIVDKVATFAPFDEHIHIHGYLGAPNLARSHRKGSFLFINGRAIFSPLVYKAVKEGYGSYISERAFPLFALFLKLPLRWVDVNVHPQKKEARFLEERVLFKTIKEAVQETLTSLSSSSIDATFSCSQENQEAILPPVSMKEPLPFLFTPPPAYSFPMLMQEEKKNPYTNFNRPILGDREQMIQTALTFEKEVPSYQKREQIFHFLLVKGEEKKLFLLDLKGLFALSLYRQMSQDKGSIDRLAFPVILELTQGQMAHFKDVEELFIKRGIEVRILGKETLAIDAFFSKVPFEEIRGLFIELLEKGKHPDERDLSALASSIGRRKKNFNEVEVEFLFSCWIEWQTPAFCPLGRKIVIPLTESILEKLFL